MVAPNAPLRSLQVGRTERESILRSHRIDVRVSEAELAELLDAAGDEPLTTWLRALALTAARALA